MSDYDSDEAPEAVTFTASKSKALDEVKAVTEAIKLTKDRQKEARKLRQEIQNQQKAEKAARLEELKKNAPTDDIFDQLPETFTSKNKVAKSNKMPVRTEFVEDEQQEDEFETEETEDFLSLETSKKRTVKRVKLREEHHGSTKFQIMSSNDHKSTYHISESVLNFRKAKLCGHLSKVKRETAQERAGRLTKLQASGKDVK